MKINSIIKLCSLLAGLFMAMTVVFVSGCSRNDYEAVFSTENITAWYLANQAGLQELLSIIKSDNRIKRMELCGHGATKDVIKTAQGTFHLTNKINYSMIDTDCVTVVADGDSVSTEKNLVVTIWVISEGVCMAMNTCKMTRLKYFADPAQYQSFFADQSKVTLTQLAGSQWYLAKGDYYN